MTTVAATSASPESAAADDREVTVLDVGGTHLRRAVWSARGGLRGLVDEPTPSHLLCPDTPVAELRERLIAAICDAVPAGATGATGATRETGAPGAIAGVSFGAALDQRSGIVYGSAPLFGDETTLLDLPGLLHERRPDVEWHVVNDVTAALLHFASAPRRQGHRKVMLMTISSGIACRTIDRRRDVIATDAAGLQGEVGHLPATAALAGEPVVLRCDCGETGHVAAYASGPGIRRMADVLRERVGGRWDESLLGKALETGATFEAAFEVALDAADPLAGELLDAVTAPVADVLRTALCLDPEIDELALTGGAAVSLGRHYRASVLGHLRRQGLYLTADRAPEWIEERVGVCGPGEANGLIGAGIAALAAATGRRMEELTHPDAAAARGGPSHRAIVRDDRGLRLRRRPTVAPGPGELSIATLVAGVCGTDLQMLRGLRSDGAPVLGHEGVARVVEAGPGADLAPGTLVVVNPTHRTDPSFLLGHNVDGLLQERTLVPATAVRDGLVVPLPEAPELARTPELAALIEPLAVVRYASLALRAIRPKTLLVFGDGTVGHLAVRTARHWLGDDVRTVHVHHTQQGVEWSAAAPHAADVRRRHGTFTPGELAAALAPDGPVAVLLATPGVAMLPCLETALAATEGREVLVDLLGGVPRAASIPALPGVNLGAIRAANCAGVPEPPEIASLTTVDGRPVRIFGHRGVANCHLLDAVTELCREPGRYRDLVTHVVDPEEAVRIMSRLSVSRRRTIDGRRLIKLAVRMPAGETR
ncbi:ROK family protein [Streptomyces sp. NPDC000410]|uniref:ROK family protein n=1 Tax=Streptomyces sp. NPDC000410 TaxID=3154254 RepID=UPI003330AB55